ncbi:MAG: hypothetical protein HY318_03415, partial [Armatimonadetes bacterium]|nr:hypothetical protein [Armatimonadota bacterium]
SLWSECRRLALEGAELAPALLSSEPGPTVKSNSPAVHVAVWRHRGDLLVLAANTENRPVPVQIQLGEKLSEKATVLFANRTILVKVGVIDDMIEGFGTRAYRVPSGEQQPPRATVNPANLTVNPSFEEFANTGTPDGCYVGVGKDIGASLFIDSRLSVHGGHSLRVCTPAEDQGVGIIPFPIQVSTGKRYRLSLWARGMQQEGLRFRFGAGMLDCGVKEFTATREWAEYSVEGTANGNHRQSLLLSLVSKGTMWFDLIQMVEVR